MRVEIKIELEAETAKEVFLDASAMLKAMLLDKSFLKRLISNGKAGADWWHAIKEGKNSPSVKLRAEIQADEGKGDGQWKPKT